MSELPIFGVWGIVVSVPAGAGFGTLAPTILWTREIPMGTQLQLESLTCMMDGIPSSQIDFMLRRNGVPIISGQHKLSGNLFAVSQSFPINEEVLPGTLDCVAFNRSGTTQPFAEVATTAQCQSSVIGRLHHNTQPLIIPKRKWWNRVVAMLLLLLLPTFAYAQSVVVPGMTTARSANPTACVNAITFALESCGGTANGLTDAQLRATPVPISGTVTTTPPANASTNVTQFGSNAVVTGVGASGVGIPRMTVANDSTIILGIGAATIGALTANQSVNLAQVAGTATVTGGLAGSLAIGGTSANNAAIVENPVLTACETIAAGTQPTVATATNQRRDLCSTEGVRYVQLGNSNPFSCFVEAVTITTQCQAAPAAGLRNYVMSIAISNEAATVQGFDIVFGTGANCATGITALTHKFQGGTLATTTSPQSISVSFPTPLRPTAANAVCIRPTAATAFGATLSGYIAP